MLKVKKCTLDRTTVSYNDITCLQSICLKEFGRV